MNGGNTATRSLRMVARPLVHAIALMVLFLALASQARAQGTREKLPPPTNAEALVHFAAGNAAYKSAMDSTHDEVRRRDFETAVREYRAGGALESEHFYTFVWNLAQAQRQLGNYAESIQLFRHFITLAPTEYRQHRNDAALLIDKMRAELEHDAVLSPPTDVAPDPVSAPPADEATQAVPAALPILRPAPHSAAQPWYSDRVGWGLSGAGVVGLVVGGVVLAQGSSLYEQSGTEPRESVAADLEDRARRRVAIGAAAGGLGLAALLGGVIKLAVAPRAARAETAIGVSLTSTSVVLTGTF